MQYTNIANDYVIRNLLRNNENCTTAVKQEHKVEEAIVSVVVREQRILDSNRTGAVLQIALNFDNGKEYNFEERVLHGVVIVNKTIHL